MLGSLHAYIVAYPSEQFASIAIGVVEPNGPGSSTSLFIVERGRCVYAERMQVGIELPGGFQLLGGNRGGAIQEWEPADGIKYPARQPARECDATDRIDGHHHYVSPARGGREGDLGQDGALWKGVARGRE